MVKRIVNILVPVAIDQTYSYRVPDDMAVSPGDLVSVHLGARGMILRMTMRMGEHLGPERVRVGVRLVGTAPKRLTPARQRVLTLLTGGLLRGKAETAEEA